MEYYGLGTRGKRKMEQYKNIFVEIFGLNPNFLPQDIVRGEIKDWDSIGHISLITKIEEKYNIIFDTKDILMFNSYLIGIELLKTYGVNL